MKNEGGIERFLEGELDNSKATCLLATVRTPKSSYDYIFESSNFSDDLDKRSTIGIGSCTKVITAITILELCQSEDIDINDGVVEYVSDFPSEICELDPTIEEFLSHSSLLASDNQAIARLEENANLRDHSFGFDDYNSFCEYVSKNMAKNREDRFSYYNTGFVILGRLVEEVTGKSFEDYVMDSVLKPSGIVPSSFGSGENSVSPYIEDDSGFNKYEYPSNSLFYSEGGLFLSIESSKSFINSFQSGWGSLLSDSSYEELVKPRISSSLGSEVDGNEYCLGLNRKKFLGSDWFTHCGISYVSSAGFSVNDDYGCFIMLNGPCGYYPSNICLGVMGHLKDRDERSVPYYGLRYRINNITGKYSDESNVVEVEVKDKQPYIEIVSKNSLVSNKILKPVSKDYDDYRFESVSEGGINRDQPVVFRNPESKDTDIWFDRFCLSSE
jgi:hypothetical protein